MDIRDLPLHGEKIEDDMGLFDHFNMKIWPEDVLYKLGVQDPLGKLQSYGLHLHHGLGVAHLVEEGDVSVHLVNTAQPHSQGRGAEILEGQLQAVLVKGEGRLHVVLDGGPQEVSHGSGWLMPQLLITQAAHVLEGSCPHRSE